MIGTFEYFGNMDILEIFKPSLTDCDLVWLIKTCIISLWLEYDAQDISK